MLTSMIKRLDDFMIYYDANLDKILEILHRSDKNTRPTLCFLSPPLRVLSHNFTILEGKNLKK